MSKPYLANTEGQCLYKHSIAVGKLASKIASNVTDKMKDDSLRKLLIKQSALAGYLHDVGKADEQFQRYILKQHKAAMQKQEKEELTAENIEDEFDHNGSKNKSFILHHQLSWKSLVLNYEGLELTNIDKIAPVTFAIYYHHSPVNNKKPEDVLEYGRNEDVNKFMLHMWEAFKRHYGKDEIQSKDFSSDNGSQFVVDRPEKLIVWTCLVDADRIISSLGKDLNDIDVENDEEALFAHPLIKNKLEKKSGAVGSANLSFLWDSQKQFLERLKQSDNNTFVVSAPPGIGKTTMGLLFCDYFRGTKSIFTAPRNTICESLYNTIDDDASRLGLSSFSKELVTANRRQKPSDDRAIYSSDTLIVNIDSILNCFFKHRDVPSLALFFTEPMVFDEYHELLTASSSILYLSRCLIKAREMCNAKTLLMSATPVNILQDLTVSHRQIEKRAEFIKLSMPESKEKEKKIHFLVRSDFSNVNSENTWIRRNTISQTQEHFSKIDRDGIIVHGRYDQRDKDAKMEAILNIYGKDSNEKKLRVVSSSITECSLNISYKTAELEISTPQSLLQSVGRVNRFSEINDDVTVYIVIEEPLSKSNRKYIESVYSLELFDQWKKFVVENLNNVCLNKNELTSLIEKFEKENQDLVEKYISDCCSKSKELAKQVTHGRSSNTKSQYIGLSNGGLRGSAGWFGIWILDKNTYKMYAFNSTFDKDVLEKAFSKFSLISFLSELNNKYLKGTKKHIIGGITFDFYGMFKEGITLPKLLRLARTSEKPFVLGAPNVPDFAFTYDSEEDIYKNIGITKTQQTNNVNDDMDLDI